MLDKAERKLTLKELVEQGKLEVGDIIPFKFTKEATYVSPCNKSGYDKSQKFTTKEIKNTKLVFLGIENGRIKTMLANPFGKFYFQTVEGHKNGTEELNNVSKAIFEGQRGVESARTLTVEDVNEVLGVKLGEKIANEITYKGYRTTGYYYYIKHLNVSNKIKRVFYIDCWLGSEFTLATKDSVAFGLHVLSSNGRVGGSNCFELIDNSYKYKYVDSTGILAEDFYEYSGTVNTKFNGVCSVVYLKSEIMIEELIREEDLVPLNKLVEQGKLKVGDIIPFKLTKEASYGTSKFKTGYEYSQSFTTYERENTDLVFLGTENGYIKTILAEPFRGLRLNGLRGYWNEELDNISKAIFEGQRGVVSARSLTVEDVNQIVGINSAKKSGRGSFKDENGHEYKDTYYSYAFGKDVSNKFKKAFSGLCWLNSQFISTGVEYVFFGLRTVSDKGVGGNALYRSSGKNYSWSFGVQSVVYLKSEITIEELMSEEELTINETSST